MTIVESRMKAVRTLQESIAAMEKKLSCTRTELSVRTKLLQDELAKGGTTGDSLLDLIITHYGLSDEAEALLRPLEAQLRGKKGECVLLLFSAEVPYKHVFGKGYEERPASCYRIGFLSGEALVPTTVEPEHSLFRHSPISLPVGQFIEGEQTVIIGKAVGAAEAVKGNIFDHHLGGFHAGNPPSLIRLLKEHEGRGLFIGDEAVKEALKKAAMPGLFALAANALGRLILEPTDD